MGRIMFVTFMFMSLISAVCIGANSNSILDKEIISFEVDNLMMPEAIIELATECKSFGILITFEEAVSSEKNTVISLKQKNASVRSILNELMKKDKSYLWESEGNIVNIIPSNKKDDNNYILNEPIEKLSIVNKTRKEIIAIILEIINKKNPDKYTTKTEKRATINKLILLEPPYKKLGISPPMLKKYNFEIKNSNIRAILNLISVEENIPWHVMLLDKTKDDIRILVFEDSFCQVPTK